MKLEFILLFSLVTAKPRNREIVGLGVDTLSPDAGASEGGS